MYIISYNIHPLVQHAFEFLSKSNRRLNGCRHVKFHWVQESLNAPRQPLLPWFNTNKYIRALKVVSRELNAVPAVSLLRRPKPSPPSGAGAT